MQRRQRTRFRQIVLNQIKELKWKVLFVGLFVLGSTITGLLAPWPLKIIFDNILLDKPLSPILSFLGGLLQSGKVFSLVLISMAIVVIAFMQGMFTYSQHYITLRIGYQMVYALRRELFAHVQRLSLSFYNRSKSGELLTRMTADTHVLKDSFGESALAFTSHILTITGIIAIMFAMNWKASLIVMLTIPVLFYAIYNLYKKVKASAKKQRKREGKIASRISEIISSVVLVQAFSQERLEQERFDTESTETLEESIRTARMEAAATRVVEIISALGVCAVILFGSLQVLNGLMTPGDVLIFVSYVNSIYKPVRQLAKISMKFSKAMVSAGRISEILEVEPEIQDDPNAIEASNLKGEIVFDKVGFNYGDGRGVLQDVSFAISPGQRVALVGPSGSGKSTIVSLILRLYDPQEGSILIDGENVRKYRRESIRRQIGVVLQESILFGATIRENIAYGKPDATMDEIIAAAGAANAHDFIMELEDGYDSLIGERGATLSGGQRRRIAIARAIIRNAPILILDEPMTGLDVKSEEKVKEALDRLMEGKTCLLITMTSSRLLEQTLSLFLKMAGSSGKGSP